MKKIDHDDVMEMAVQLTCSYLGTSHSASTNAEDLILGYYRQIRNVEARLSSDYSSRESAMEEEQEMAMAA